VVGRVGSDSRRIASPYLVGVTGTDTGVGARRSQTPHRINDHALPNTTGTAGQVGVVRAARRSAKFAPRGTGYTAGFDHALVVADAAIAGVDACLTAGGKSEQDWEHEYETLHVHTLPRFMRVLMAGLSNDGNGLGETAS
jgi:hypothetical protein